MSETIKPWLEETLIQYAQDHGKDLKATIIGRKCQIYHMFNMQEAEKPDVYIWAQISDKERHILARFSKESLANHYEEWKTYLHQFPRGVLTLLLLYPLMAIPPKACVPSDGEPCLILDIRAFKYIGGAKQALHGKPVSIYECRDISLWQDDLRRGRGDVLKERAISNPLPKPLEKQSSLTAHLAPLNEKAKTPSENISRKGKERDPVEQWKIDVWGGNWSRLPDKWFEVPADQAAAIEVAIDRVDAIAPQKKRIKPLEGIEDDSNSQHLLYSSSSSESSDSSSDDGSHHEGEEGAGEEAENDEDDESEDEESIAWSESVRGEGREASAVNDGSNSGGESDGDDDDDVEERDSEAKPGFATDNGAEEDEVNRSLTEAEMEGLESMSLTKSYHGSTMASPPPSPLAAARSQSPQSPKVPPRVHRRPPVVLVPDSDASQSTHSASQKATQSQSHSQSQVQSQSQSHADTHDVFTSQPVSRITQAASDLVTRDAQEVEGSSALVEPKLRSKKSRVDDKETQIFNGHGKAQSLARRSEGMSRRNDEPLLQSGSSKAPDAVDTNRRLPSKSQTFPITTESSNKAQSTQRNSRSASSHSASDQLERKELKRKRLDDEYQTPTRTVNNPQAAQSIETGLTKEALAQHDAAAWATPSFLKGKQRLVPNSTIPRAQAKAVDPVGHTHRNPGPQSTDSRGSSNKAGVAHRTSLPATTKPTTNQVGPFIDFATMGVKRRRTDSLQRTSDSTISIRAEPVRAVSSPTPLSRGNPPNVDNLTQSLAPRKGYSSTTGSHLPQSRTSVKVEYNSPSGVRDDTELKNQDEEDEQAGRLMGFKPDITLRREEGGRPFLTWSDCFSILERTRAARQKL